MNLEQRIARLESLHPDLVGPEWVEVGRIDGDEELHRINPATGEMQYESPPGSGHWVAWQINLPQSTYQPLFAMAYNSGLAQGRKPIVDLARAILEEE